jgi:hypothetical protein
MSLQRRHYEDRAGTPGVYRQRNRVRLEKERTERRQRKEEESARRKAEQPVLFEF